MRKIIQIAFASHITHSTHTLHALWDDGSVSFWDGTARDGIWRDLVWEKGQETKQKEIE